MSITSSEYLKRLQVWLAPAMNLVYEPEDNKEMASYGPGNHGHWAQQANTTAFTAFAVMAADPGYDESMTGVSRQQLLECALKMMRFSLRSHNAGGSVTFDGKSWGRSWISSLCLERMMHGIEAIEEHLSPEDWMILQAVLESECNYLIDEYEVVGGIDGYSGRNRPESNLWNGAILHRTCLMFADTARKAEYMEWGTRYLLNAISIPSDRTDSRSYAGKPLSQWHVGPNFTDNYGLNHHQYLNVGYMVICLSNIAMLHFSYKKRNISAPEALYHHAEELWNVIKSFTFPDGRLWRIGGDTRVRYCYCQDYAIPMWLLALDKFGDQDAQRYEEGWFDLVRIEQDNNGDGTFLGERLAELEDVSPLYFARLEGDKAATLSMAAYWRRIFNEFNDTGKSSKGCAVDWDDAFHGAMSVHGNRRMASFTWKAAQGPMAQCVPANDSSLAEWQWNMVGEIRGTSDYVWTNPLIHTHRKFPGGFCTCGKMEWWAGKHVAEGQEDELTAVEKIAFAALPDDATVIVLQQASTVNRTYLKEVKGLMLNVPNDIFNKKKREYSSESGSILIDGCVTNQDVDNLMTNTVLIDHCLKVELVNPDQVLSLHRPGRRQVKLHNKGSHTLGRSGGNLYCDEICCPCTITRKHYPADEVLFDLAAVVSVATEVENTPAVFETGYDRLMAVSLAGANRKKYLFVANFGPEAEYTLTNLNEAVLISGNEGVCTGNSWQLTLGAFESVLFEIGELHRVDNT